MTVKRYTTLFLCFALAAPIIIAQPVIDHTALPTGSYSTQFYVVTQPGTTNIADNGANIQWDLTSATLQLAGSSVLGPASQTPYASQFPAANWCFSQDLFGFAQYYAYFTGSNSALEIVGDGLPDDPETYSDAKKILQFPLSYNGSFTDTYTNSSGTSSVTWYYMGYGTAISDLGTHTDLVKMVSSEGDFILWHTQPLHPFVIYDGSNVRVFVEGPTSIDEMTGDGIGLYPNPADDQIMISGSLNGPYVINDITGRVVARGRLVHASARSIDISELVPGTYHLTILDEGGSRGLRFIKQ